MVSRTGEQLNVPTEPPKPQYGLLLDGKRNQYVVYATTTEEVAAFDSYDDAVDEVLRRRGIDPAKWRRGDE